MGKVFSGQNGAKILPYGVAHTYIAYMREYPYPLGNVTNVARISDVYTEGVKSTRS